MQEKRRQLCRIEGERLSLKKRVADVRSGGRRGDEKFELDRRLADCLSKLVRV